MLTSKYIYAIIELRTTKYFSPIEALLLPRCALINSIGAGCPQIICEMHFWRCVLRDALFVCAFCKLQTNFIVYNFYQIMQAVGLYHI